MEATYLVECFWPGVTREAVEAANERARERAALLRREGSSLRFLGSLLVPVTRSFSSSSGPPRARKLPAHRARPSCLLTGLPHPYGWSLMKGAFR
jgi:hypothetical protein